MRTTEDQCNRKSQFSSPGRVPASKRAAGRLAIWALGIPLCIGYLPARAAVPLPAQPAPILTPADASWIEEFFYILDCILTTLGSSQSVAGATPEQAMSIVANQYAATGIPSSLSPIDRLALHAHSAAALALLNIAPPDVDPDAVAAFRPTLRSIMKSTSPLPFP